MTTLHDKRLAINRTVANEGTFVGRGSERTRPAVYILACIPGVDCILNQLNTAFHITIGQMSILEAVRAPMLVTLIIVCIWRMVSRGLPLSTIPLSARTAVLLVGIVTAKEAFDTGFIAFSSINCYGQLLYWLALWSCVQIECRSAAEATVILRGLVIAALITAGSVAYGYFAGGPNPYLDDGVIASAGWFTTAKTITGVLSTGAILLLYLGSRSDLFRYPLLAVVCCVCCVLTYARAGQVALVAAVLWIVIWYVANASATGAKTLFRFIAAMTLIAAVSLPVMLRSQSFVARWQDIHDTEEGGSGRAGFWRIAVEEYGTANIAQICIGFGYSQMDQMLFKDTGANIHHTHNDLLDVMLLGGICGIAWWIGLMGTFVRNAVREIRSVEGMAAMGIIVIFAFHGQLTGQLMGTDAMVMYSSGMACLSIIQRDYASRRNYRGVQARYLYSWTAEAEDQIVRRTTMASAKPS
jgi:O-antigen ligase